jgi:ABC-type sugar transport system substrate-binding protein
MKRRSVGIAVIAFALSLFVVQAVAASGRSQAATPAAPRGTSAVSEKGGTFTADSFGYKPVENTTGKQIRIAVLCVQNNPFWADVTAGAYAAKAVLAMGQYNCIVDYKDIKDFNGQEFSDAIEACIVQGYNAITTVGAADSIVPAIDKAVAAGIAVYTFNSDTGRVSKKTAFVGQDLYGAGVKSCETLGQLIGGQGKVAIMTGLFSVNAHELRRQGGEEGLKKYPGITILPAVETHDSADEGYTHAKNFITANPDLKGIYNTAGGSHGVAKAIEELGKTDSIAFVCFDTYDELLPYIRSGAIDSVLTQDPFGQGSDPIILAYNEIVTGRPEKTGNAFTKMDEVTPANVNQFFPQ